MSKRKFWWTYHGDIDNSWDIVSTEVNKNPDTMVYTGPFHTLTEAKADLLAKFRYARDEIIGCIDDIINAKASKLDHVERKFSERV